MAGKWAFNLDRIQEKHAAILGTTDTGKTVLATALFRDLKKKTLFINTAGEPYPEKTANVVIDDPNDIIPALHKYNKVCYDIEDPKELDQILEQIKPVGEAINARGQRERWLTVFIDEVHLWGGKQGTEALNYFWTNGLRYGIVAIGITQRPAFCPHVILTQSHNYFFLGLTDYERQYLERYGFNFDEITAWTDKKYNVYVISGQESYKQKPVKI